MADSYNLTGLDLIGQDTLDFLQISSKAQKDQDENLKKAEKVSNEKVGIYKEISDAAGVASLAQSAAIMAAEKKVAQAATAAGLDPKGGTDRLHSLIQETTTVSEEVRNRIRDVTQRKNLSFFDDPLQFIANQFLVPIAEERLVNSATQLDFLQKQIGQVDAQMGAATRIAKVTTESMTVAQAEALAKIAAGEAAIRARDAELEGIKYNSAAVQNAISAPKERLDSIYNLVNAQMRASQFVLALEEFEQRKTQWNWTKAEKEAQDQAKREGKQLDEVFVGHIQRGYAALGMPQPSPLELKSQVQLLKSGASKELTQVYEIGRRSAITGISSIGTSPADTIDNLEKLPNNVSPARLEALALIKQVKEQVLVDPKIDKKNKAQVDGEINKLVYQTIGGQLASITPGSGNIFDIGDLGGYLANPNDPQMGGVPGFSELPLAKKVLIPAVAAKVSLADPAKVLGITAAAIQDGTISSTEAVDNLTFLYRKANLINQTALGLQGLGIQVPNDGMSYNARLGAFKGTIDMTSPAAVGQWLAKDLAERTFRESKTRQLPGLTSNEGGAAFIYSRP